MHVYSPPDALPPPWPSARRRPPAQRCPAPARRPRRRLKGRLMLCTVLRLPPNHLANLRTLLLSDQTGSKDHQTLRAFALINGSPTACIPNSGHTHKCPRLSHRCNPARSCSCNLTRRPSYSQGRSRSYTPRRRERCHSYNKGSVRVAVVWSGQRTADNCSRGRWMR
jgi:hypothetical protein